MKKQRIKVKPKKPTRWWTKTRVLYQMSNEKKEATFEEFKSKYFNKAEYDKYVNELMESDFWKKLSSNRKYNRYHCDSGINPKAMRNLYAWIRKYKPNVLLETGIKHGFSTSIFLYALHSNKKGVLISVDSWRDSDRGLYVPKELTKRWIEIVCPTSLYLPLVDFNIDFFCHDSAHTVKDMTLEYEWALKHMKKGLITSHDVGTNNAFFDFVKKHNLKWYLVETAAPARFGLGVAEVGVDSSKTMLFNLFSFITTIYNLIKELLNNPQSLNKNK